MTSQVEEKYTELIKQGMFPIARWGVPEDVAKAVRAFCSDDFCYTTGNYIDVDGGFHIRRFIGCGFSIWILTGYLFYQYNTIIVGTGAAGLNAAVITQ